MPRLLSSGRLSGRAILFATSLCLFLAGCGDRNPLIGKWKLDLPAGASEFEKAAASSLGEQIEFKSGSMILNGGAPLMVSFEHRDDHWFAKVEGQGEIGAIAIRVDGDRIFIEGTPNGGIPFTRVK
ncbi:hypothetical protein UAJ10_02145 [Nitrospirillum sp. BR 11164]|uniref:hypothetical protein n=1 Tax=Nitrospirillum sp. BR 11164 TaxID=3104324 RepID=UPI002AFF11CA|nr:hypothetical protein [Nitrospirillum sp. BR 11164]MEA1647820.1 hypothetical protein [Nitrospirillum sp. BR 11164]